MSAGSASNCGDELRNVRAAPAGERGTSFCRGTNRVLTTTPAEEVCPMGQGRRRRIPRPMLSDHASGVPRVAIPLFVLLKDCSVSLSGEHEGRRQLITKH